MDEVIRGLIALVGIGLAVAGLALAPCGLWLKLGIGGIVLLFLVTSGGD